MLTLNDGRSELYQWDTGRKIAVDADCSQVHFSNKVFGRSIDVAVVDGVAKIPDILLQTDKDLNVWAFVGTPENGYTKISKTFKVNRRNKPADYVFTPPDQTSLEEIKEKIEHLGSIQDPDAIKNAVYDYLQNNPIKIDEEDPTVPNWAKQPTKPIYTASEVGALPANTVIPTIPDNVSAFRNDAGYLTEHQDISGKLDASALPTAINTALAQAKASGEFDGKDGEPGKNGQDYILTEADKNEIAELAAELVEAPGSGGNADLTGYATEQWVKDQNFLTEVPDGYAKSSEIPKKPEDIGAQPSGNYALKSEIPSVPVQSVNGKTGAVQLSAADVGARPENWMPSAQEVGALPNTYTPPNQTAEQVGADPKGTATTLVSQHNTADDSHNDIRLELKAINDRLTSFFDSDDQTLDELSEIVAYITTNKKLIDSITTSKVSVADIIDNLTTNVRNKPLSAAQGVVLKGLIDTVGNSLANYQPKGDYALRSELPTVPTNVSAFTNDAGYLTQHQDISHKLDANKLPEAVNTALAQAKASGEFKGEKGDTGDTGHQGPQGEQGPAGPAGADGKTPVKGTDYYTEADKTEMVNAVIAALPTWNGGSY